ncbi:MAG: hypothetical protein ACXQTC_04360, partial [Methanopyraceae archaeon]
TVYVDVVPYVDSDAWSGEHVTALRDFLSWCGERGVKVAIFHYNFCERTAPGITQVIREFANQGVVTLVGLHTVSHSLGNLPVSVQYLELKYNAEFLKENVQVSVDDRVLSVPYWVLSPRTLRACALYGVRVIVSGNSPATLSANHDPVWDKLTFPAPYMVPGKFEVNGTTIYHLPAVTYSELANTASSRNTTIGDLLRDAVRSLLDSGLVPTDRDARLTLAVLVHPWELADDSVLNGLKQLLSQVASRELNFNYKGTSVRFRLADPRRVVDDLLSGRFEGPVVSLPEPEYRRVLQSKGFDPWWKLSERYPDKSDLVRIWREAVQTLESVDAELLALMRAGRVDERLDALLRRLAEAAVDEVELNSMIKHWDANAAALSIQRFAGISNEVYAEVTVRFSELIKDVSNGVRLAETEIEEMVKEESKIKNDVDSLRKELSGVSGEVSSMRRDLKSLASRVSDLEHKIKSVEEHLSVQSKEENDTGTGPETRTPRGDRSGSKREKVPIYAVTLLAAVLWGLGPCRWRRGSSCGCWSARWRWPTPGSSGSVETPPAASWEGSWRS